ncbi:uncharacterized protein LOC125042005 [Penaeus chinensis]|uniref:uncharacterized protein LOC125042005 n=1 Tax=Penaeus chinensis TaxID=139456 RepID=UPI001FB84283|nr:uncharacterized protein LOC125042005 [Penaeus chinensis]
MRVDRTVPPRGDTHVEQISVEGVAKSLQKMKSRKAGGPDNMQRKAWKIIGNTGVDCLRGVHKCYGEGRDARRMKKQHIDPYISEQGGIQDCSSYRGIRLASHTLKTATATDREVQERPERAGLCVHRFKEGSRQDDFQVTVGLHQGSALGPFLFAILIDCLTGSVQKESPWDIEARDVALNGEKETGVKMEEAEMSMFVYTLGETRMDKIGNEVMRKDIGV